MPTATYTPLANITLGSSAASVTFSSITSYRDYIIVFSGTVSGGDGIYVRFNSDTGSNYSFVRMYGTGSATGSTSGTLTRGEFGEVWTGQGQATIQIFDANATDKHKSWLGRSDAPANNTMAYAGRWANTAAITSIQVGPSTATMSAGSTLTLYGIAS